MPRKVHDGPAIGTAQRTAPEQPQEWEPRPLPGNWWQTCQERHALAERLLTAFTDPGPDRGRDQTRRRGLTKLLDWLQSQPGETWQDRWLASGADAAGFEWAGLPLGGEPSPRHRRDELTSGLVLLVAGQAIRPTYRWLMRQRHALMLAEARKAIDPGGFGRLEQHAQDAIGWARSDALNKLTWIVICKGGLVADVTVGDCVELTAALEEHHFRGSAGRPLFYALLKETGILPAAAPPRLRALRIDGRRSIEQIIDKYGIECRPVRDLMVEYFTERAPDLDHTSLRSVARTLCRLFWRDLEIHHPGIDSLHLAPEVARAWKERLSCIRDADGHPIRPRVNFRTELVFVKAFYEDIARWAADDPARWARWVTPCPVRASECATKKSRSGVKSRMDQRTRAQLPLLPALVRAVEQQRKAAEHLLTTARDVPAGDLFTVAGQQFQRRRPGPSGRVYVIEVASGQETQPHPRRRSLVLVVGDRGGPACERHQDRGDAGAHPPQLRRIHPARHRRDRPHAAGRPIQDRRRETPAGLPGAGRGPHRDHLPGPARQGRPAAGVGLRRVRTDLERTDAVLVPAPLRLRGPPHYPQLHPRMHGRHLSSRADHRRRSAAAMAPP